MIEEELNSTVRGWMVSLLPDKRGEVHKHDFVMSRRSD
jgi:hypothetical protein